MRAREAALAQAIDSQASDRGFQPVPPRCPALIWFFIFLAKAGFALEAKRADTDACLWKNGHDQPPLRSQSAAAEA